MADLPDLRGRIRLDWRDLDQLPVRAAAAARGVEAGLRPAEDALKRLPTHSQNASRGFGVLEAAGAGITRAATLSAFALGGVGIAMGGVALSSIRQASSLEQSRIAFNTLLGSAQKADTFIRDLQHFAATTPFEFVGLQEQAKRLLAYGFSAQEIIPMLTRVGNATAALGSGQEGLDRITYALGQIHAAGVLHTQDLNQLAQQGIPVWQLLADATHRSQIQVRKDVEQSKVSSETFFTAWNKFADTNYGGLMAKQSDTILGIWSNIQDAWTQTSAVIGAAIIKTFDIKGILLSVSGGLQQLQGVLQGTAQPTGFLKVAMEGLHGVGQALGPVFAAVRSAIASAMGWIIANWPEIQRGFAAVWSSVQSGWAAIQPLLANFRQNLAELAPVFQYIRDHAENLRPVLFALGVAVGLVIAILAAVGVVAVLVVAALVWIASKVAEAIPQWRAAGDEIVATGRRADEMMKQYMAAVGAAFSWVGTQLHTAGQQYSQLGTDVRTTFDNVGRLIRQYQADIGAVFSWVGTQLRTAVGQYQQAGRDIGDTWARVVSLLQGYGRDIMSVFTAIANAGNALGNAIWKAFDGLGTTVHNALHAVSQVFDKFAGLVNGALGAFSVHINPTGYASGGVVPGYAPGVDSVPAMLSPGEGILTPQTTRNMGGAAAIDALNRAQGRVGMGGGLGAAADAMGAVSTAIGAIGGQCVEFLQRLLGLSFHGNANTWVNAPYQHTQQAAAGELAVFTGGPYGHLAMVTNPMDGYTFEVLDSNWVAPLTIGRHLMTKGTYGFATFLNPGISGVSGLLNNIVGALLGPSLQTLLSPLTGIAHAAAGAIPEPWARGMANSIIDKLAANITARAAGGTVIPGHLYSVGERGPELFSSDVPGQIIPNGAGGLGSARTERLLQAIVDVLGEINGTPQLTRRDASRRYAT